jgi:hypothetical protein
MTKTNAEEKAPEKHEEVPAVLTPGKVIRMVTEILHGLQPQPDQTVIQTVIHELTARMK